MGLPDYIKQVWGLYRVGGHYARTLRLEKENRLEPAYQLASDALGILWRLESRSSAVVTMTLLMTTLLDKIALRLERPLMTKDAIAKTLDLCQKAGFEEPKPGDALKEHIDWLRYRRSDQSR